MKLGTGQPGSPTLPLFRCQHVHNSPCGQGPGHPIWVPHSSQGLTGRQGFLASKQISSPLVFAAAPSLCLLSLSLSCHFHHSQFGCCGKIQVSLRDQRQSNEMMNDVKIRAPIPCVSRQEGGQRWRRRCDQ